MFRAPPFPVRVTSRKHFNWPAHPQISLYGFQEAIGMFAVLCAAGLAVGCSTGVEAVARTLFNWPPCSPGRPRGGQALLSASEQRARCLLSLSLSLSLALSLSLYSSFPLSLSLTRSLALALSLSFTLRERPVSDRPEIGACPGSGPGPAIAPGLSRPPANPPPRARAPWNGGAVPRARISYPSPYPSLLSESLFGSVLYLLPLLSFELCFRD